MDQQEQTCGRTVNQLAERPKLGQAGAGQEEYGRGSGEPQSQAALGRVRACTEGD